MARKPERKRTSTQRQIETIDQQRLLLAKFCRLLVNRNDPGEKSHEKAAPSADEMATGTPSASTAHERLLAELSVEKGITPRMRQTLECLLFGDSEKQIASKLQISRHTVHIYVKQLYKKYGVSSRGELFAR